MKKTLYLILVLLFPLASNAQLNLELLAHVPNDSLVTLAGCWHHVDNQGKEYALIGTRLGLDIYDVNVPTAPQRIFQVPGIVNNWREVRTHAGYAYVGSEAQGSGITIVDLNYLPDTIYTKVWFGDGLFDTTIRRSHAVGTADGYLYIYGSQSAPSSGAIICDLVDPWNPTVIGTYKDNYCHDGFVKGDTLYGSEIYKGQFSVVDISDRTNPVLLTTQVTPGKFNHNSELSKNGKILFTTDEIGNTPVGAFDVSDLSNITLLDTYFPSQRPSGEVHNVRRFQDDYLVCPSYKGQLTIVDASDPTNMIETAWAILGNSIVWDADPYFPSGIVIATAKNEGLHIFKPTYARASRLEGLVTDATTGFPLLNAKVFVENTPNADTTNLAGVYKTGAATAGVYNVRAEREGYFTQTKTIDLAAPGQTYALNFELVVTPVSATEPAFASTFIARYTSGMLTIELPNELAGQPKPIRVVDVQGRVMYAGTVSQRLTQVPAFWPNGVYFVEIEGKVVEVAVRQ